MANFYQRLQRLELAFGVPTLANRPDNTQGVPMPIPGAQPAIANLADTIANMLHLDLSAATSPMQQDQLVANAVEALVLKLREVSGESDQDVDDDADIDYSGDTEQDFAPGDIDSEGDTTQNSQQGATDADSEDIPIEENNYDEQQEPVTQGQTGTTAPSPKRKKPPVNQPSALSLDLNSEMGQQLAGMMSANRRIQINMLAQNGFITPHTQQIMLSQYCDGQGLALALSQCDSEGNCYDGFDQVCEMLRVNGPVINYGEFSGAQANIKRLKPNGEVEDLTADELMDESVNPLLQDAKRRRDVAAQAVK